MVKIVVTIKQMLDPSGFTVNRRRERVFVNREEYIINPADLNALEAALRVKDDHAEVEVIVLGLGPPRVDDALREAIARGADRAVLITDSALPAPARPGSRQRAGVAQAQVADLKADTAGSARLMAAAIEKIGDVSLVMCGAVALDSGAGELPGRLAGALGWPMLAEVTTLDEMSHGVVRASQRGLRWEADLPALLTVPRDANEPRHIYGARAINAYREQDQVVTWGLNDMGFIPDDLEPMTQAAGRRFPPERALGTRLEGSVEEAVKSLVAQLRANELIEARR
jgi:electron transfer flavoprotein beta subunit